MEEKQVRITEVIFQNKENGYTVAIGENEEEQLTVVGTLPISVCGREFLLRGKFKVHPTYGEQFAFSEFEEVLPKTADGIESFLASGLLKGIGKKTARLIVQHFGDKTLEVMEEDPARLAEVDGIGPKRADMIAQSFRAHREFASMCLYFRQFDISTECIMKLYKVYGSDTIVMVEENPYRLVDDIFGIGFRKADKIAEKLGVARNDEYRIKSGIKYVLGYFRNEGHTFLPQEELFDKTSRLLDVSSDEIYDRLVELAFEGDVHVENLDGRPVVFLMPYYLAEQNVCKRLLNINTSGLKPLVADIDGLIKRSEAESGMTLSEKQKYAIRSSVVSGVSVITGGPGTGKTTIINTIIRILQQGGLSTAIAAPTGRAAKRITETSGFSASTIHRLLEYYYSEDDDNMCFGRNEENPLEEDAIIIDEASMIDIMLMNALMSAIKPGTRLILVGDADQLPPVGAGNVLHDILASEVLHSIRLTEIFRQAKESMIVVNAHRINRGEYPDCNAKGKDFFLMRTSSEKVMLDTIKDLCIRRLPAYYKAVMPVKDIQVLTPVRKGLLGTINLNAQLQSVFNPPAAGLEERKYGDKVFREGDKVMQIKNNYQLKWKKLDDFSEGDGVFNGDVGFIERIDKEYGEMTVVYDETKFVTYDFSQLDELELAYAVTVHKSQGSEFPIVVMPMTWCPPMLATRNLLYTAVTRGKSAVVLVGSENQMKAMVDNNKITERYSGLGVRLKNQVLEFGMESLDR